MKYFIFKAPYKKGDSALEEMGFEPSEFLIGMKAQKYGSVVIMSEEDVKKEEENGN